VEVFYLAPNWLCPLLVTSRHGQHRKRSLSIVVWIRCRRDMFTTLLRSNGLGADQRKHRSSLDVPLIRSCLLLWESVYRAVAQKRPWYIRPSRCRCIATSLQATILLNYKLEKYKGIGWPKRIGEGEVICWGNSLEGLNLETEQFHSFRHLLRCCIQSSAYSTQIKPTKNKEKNKKTWFNFMQFNLKRDLLIATYWFTNDIISRGTFRWKAVTEGATEYRKILVCSEKEHQNRLLLNRRNYFCEIATLKKNKTSKWRGKPTLQEDGIDHMWPNPLRRWWWWCWNV
jgi:hypothetical protein